MPRDDWDDYGRLRMTGMTRDDEMTGMTTDDWDD